MSITRNDIQVGLRVDVDTLEGTRDGVPYLVDLFAQKNIKASIFFSIGPDNMGRHLWRLRKPAFLLKMLRSNAASLYGWRILFQGTLWPGKKIGKHAFDSIQKAANAQHEIGFHAWDHHLWQAKSEHMSRELIAEQIDLGISELSRIINKSVYCSAVAGWVCTDNVLLEKENYHFHYNSDCRGRSIFLPVVGQHILNTPQIPTTLPTYDEVIGRNGIDDNNYNDYLLSLIKHGQLNVLTIHAEVEGISRRKLFEQFLDLAKKHNITFKMLGDLLPADTDKIPPNKIELKSITGREGSLCWQANEEF